MLVHLPKQKFYMKKLFIAAIIGLSLTAGAQNISKNALGLRFGQNDGFGAEVSYQRKLQKDNRLEIDLGWRNRNKYYNDFGDGTSIKLTGLYQWVWNIEGDFNWYAGVGGGLGNESYDYRFKDERYNDSNSYAFLAGNIGIEYDFDIPLLVSLDFRPEFYLSKNVRNGYGSDIALSLRYQF